MNAKINKHVLNAERISSHSLGVLGSIAHPVKEEGSYLGTVLLKQKVIAKVRLNVNADVKSTQVDIDFAASHNAKMQKGSAKEIIFSLNTNGYLMLYVSNGPGGYHFLLDKIDDSRSKRVFDSRSLSKDDLFILTLIRPGSYDLLDRSTKNSSKITVAYPQITKSPFTPDSPVNIDVTPSGFKSKQIKVDPGQGIILQVDKPKSSFVLTLAKPDDGTKRTRKSKSTHHWTNPIQ